MRDVGLTLVLFGLTTTVFGFLLTSGIKVPLLGRLPGDIFIDNEHVKVFIPLTSSILMSIVITVILNLFKR